MGYVYDALKLSVDISTSQCFHTLWNGSYYVPISDRNLSKHRMVKQFAQWPSAWISSCCSNSAAWYRAAALVFWLSLSITHGHCSCNSTCQHYNVRESLSFMSGIQVVFKRIHFSMKKKQKQKIKIHHLYHTSIMLPVSPT